MMRMLLWKEYREVRWVVPLAILIQYLIFGYWRVTAPEHESGPTVTLFLTTLTAVLLGAWISSKENDRGTLTQLLTLPVSRRAIWTSKVVTLITVIVAILIGTLPLGMGWIGRTVDKLDHGGIRMAALLISMPFLGATCGLFAGIHCRSAYVSTFAGGFLLAGSMFLIGEHLQSYWVYAYGVIGSLFAGIASVSFLRDDLFDRGRTWRRLPLRVIAASVLLTVGLVPYDRLTRAFPHEANLTTVQLDARRGKVVTSWMLGSWIELNQTTRAAVRAVDLGAQMKVTPALAGQASEPEREGRGFVVHHSPERDRWLVWDQELTFGIFAPRAVLKLWSPGTGWRVIDELPAGSGSYRVLASSPDTPRIAVLASSREGNERIHRLALVEEDGSLTSVMKFTSVRWRSDEVRVCAAFLPGTGVLAYSTEASPGELFLERKGGDTAAPLVFPAIPGREAVKGEALIDQLRASPALGLVAAIRAGGGAGPLQFYTIDAKTFTPRYRLTAGDGIWQLAGADRRVLVHGEKQGDGAVLVSRDLVADGEVTASLTAPATGLIVSPDGTQVLVRHGLDSFPSLCILGDGYHTRKEVETHFSILDLARPAAVRAVPAAWPAGSRVTWFDEDRLLALSAANGKLNTTLHAVH